MVERRRGGRIGHEVQLQVPDRGAALEGKKGAGVAQDGGDDGALLPQGSRVGGMLDGQAGVDVGRGSRHERDGGRRGVVRVQLLPLRQGGLPLLPVVLLWYLLRMLLPAGRGWQLAACGRAAML